MAAGHGQVVAGERPEQVGPLDIEAKLHDRPAVAFARHGHGQVIARHVEGVELHQGFPVLLGVLPRGILGLIDEAVDRLLFPLDFDPAILHSAVGPFELLGRQRHGHRPINVFAMIGAVGHNAELQRADVGDHLLDAADFVVVDLGNDDLHLLHAVRANGDFLGAAGIDAPADGGDHLVHLHFVARLLLGLIHFVDQDRAAAEVDAQLRRPAHHANGQAGDAARTTPARSSSRNRPSAAICSASCRRRRRPGRWPARSAFSCRCRWTDSAFRWPPLGPAVARRVDMARSLVNDYARTFEFRSSPARR